ncbi:codanin-1 isoform X2 [Ambystoma mexicanum]|uniref:codanin-1 isoform X2 n=1 Tax=Ambystoma mexicanum TaxID=8296 RepID=UPI0037E74F80
MAAEALELLLREEVAVATILHRIKHAQGQLTLKEKSVNPELQTLTLVQKDFVPFLLNFLREQTSQILTNGPSTPAKTPNAKSVASSSGNDDYPKTRGLSERRAENTLTHRGSRTQLFSQTPNSSCTSDAFFPSSPSPSSGSSFFTKSSLSFGCSDFPSQVSHSSPSFSSSPLPSHLGEKRSTQKMNLGQFIVFTPDNQAARRSRRKNHSSGCTPAHSVARDLGQSLNDEDGRMENPSGSGGWRRTAENVSASPPPPMLNLLNLEEFPPVGTTSGSSSKNKPSRRINPTPVSAERPLSKAKNCFTSTPLNTSPGTGLRRGANSDAFSAEEEGCGTASPHISLHEEREMLKKERSKLIHQSSSSSVPATVPTTPTRPIYNRSMTVPTDSLLTCAELNKVTCRTQLELLAQLYSACITENLVPNVFLELFFVLQLLTSRGMSSADDGQDDLEFPKGWKDAMERQHFRSVHNCVYFAVQVLERQFPILSHLDKGTLKLLAENERISTFSPGLQERLVKAHENSIAKVSLPMPSYIQSVSFQPETDNRSNFPSDRAFHIFKKQRDVFYELLRDWEDKHEQTGWAFEGGLGHRIRAIMENLTATSNHSHFARLFQKQLIQMCKGSVGGGGSASGDAPDQDVLNMLGSDNLIRLKRLQERFVAPQSIGGPCPPPSFPGCQEFFRDFIVSARSFQFNQHLMDSLCQKILHLDGLALIEHEPSDGEADTDEQDEKHHFTSILMTLRLLAKFLGFITFLPYHTTDPPMKGDLQESAVALRNQTLPGLDVLGLLSRCIQSRRTILTVPWMVEFLSLVDHVAPFLDYYSRVFTLLLHLYRCMILSEEKETNFLNKLLILAVLGWLFQVPTIPEEMFFTSEAKQDDFPADTVSTAQSLDCVPLVDQQLLYICCPYLSELRKLLASFVAGSGSKNGGFIRKITPTAAEPLVPKPAQTQKKLQAALEQAFFHNQPPSLRRTVEFVAERVGSNCVKHIKATLVADLVKRAEVMLQDKVTEDHASHSKLLDMVCAQLYDDGRQALDKGREFCKKKGPEAVRVLLPEETSFAVLKSAEDIAVGLAIEKACSWLSTNITALIKREVKATFSRMLKAQGVAVTEMKGDVEGVTKTCPASCDHTTNHRPALVITEFKEVLCIAVGPRNDDETVPFGQLENLLHRLSRTLRCRKWETFLFMLRGLLENGLMGYTEAESYLHHLQEFPWPPNFLSDLQIISAVFKSEHQAEAINKTRASEVVRLSTGTLRAQS